MIEETNGIFFVGIAGGSGSGKTTFAKKIIDRLPNTVRPEVALIHQDSYYLSKPSETLRVRGKPNFDHPEAFDWDLLKSHLQQLKAGKKVEVPVYDFKVNRRVSQTQMIGPCQSIIMEGIFILWDNEVRNLFNLKVYLNVEADIRFIRRLHRDVKERGRSVDSIIRQYYDSVRPMHHEFLDPTKQYADIIVGEETEGASDVIAARISASVGRENHQ
jgi:uridine kinase